ncbi:MAG: MarR family transcriptional regulator [Alphaproteobacteria bacterium]|nr:MarR family transcriptional regulator [Alphaproteobacteria bacterium]
MSGVALRRTPGLADRGSVRLWLRLLSLTTMIEKRLRRAFEARFPITLPRFDVMAALDRHPEGMRMTALSRELLVSNGNVTGLVRGLKRDGLIDIHRVPSDGRAAMVRLTEAGQALFDDMAEVHRQWIDAMLGDLAVGDRDRLYDLLGALKASLARHDPDQETRT